MAKAIAIQPACHPAIPGQEERLRHRGLVEELGLANHHLAAPQRIEERGIIQGTIEGTSVSYCINPKVWKQYKDLFIAF